MFVKCSYEDEFSKNLIKETADVATRSSVDPRLLNPKFRTVFRRILNNQPLEIGGNPGTGKTSSVYWFAYHHVLKQLGIEVPVCKISCDKAKRPNSFLAKTVFNAFKGVNGDDRETVVIIQLLLLSFIEGYICILDDVRQLAPDCMTIANQIAELPNVFYNEEIVGEDGKPVIFKRHPNFRLVLTSNPGCRGNSPLPPALKRRAPLIVIDDQDEKGFMLVGKTNYPFLSDDFLRAAYRLCTSITEYSKQAGNAHVSCGISQLLSCMKSLNGALDVPPLNEFCENVEVDFLNMMRDEMRDDLVEAFKTAQATQCMMVEMYRKYQACARPAGDGQQESPAAQQPDPQEDTAVAASPNSGMSLFDDLYNRKI